MTESNGDKIMCSDCLGWFEVATAGYDDGKLSVCLACCDKRSSRPQGCYALFVTPLSDLLKVASTLEAGGDEFGVCDKIRDAVVKIRNELRP